MCIRDSNNLFNIGHVGIQSIYSEYCTFNNNIIDSTFGAAFVQYGSTNTTIENNTFRNTLIKSYNGYGSGTGDHQGQFVHHSNLQYANPHQFISKIINNSLTQSKTINSVIVFFDSNIKSSYSGSDLFYFENNVYEDNMTMTLDNWNITNLNQTSSTVDLSSHNATELNDITNSGSGQIITNSERTLITTNQTNIATNANNIASNLTNLGTAISNINNKQDVLTFNGPASNNSNPSTSAQIKSYVDANAGGGGTDHIFFSAEQGTSTYQLADDATNFVVSRSAGYSSGTTMTLIMPQNPSNHQCIYIHSLGLESNDTGKIILEIQNSGVKWRNSAYNLNEATNPNLYGASASKKLELTKYRRKSYLVFYYEY